MTFQAATEPSVTEFEATVERVEDTRLVLSETYFYPESGGQPADRGALAGQSVRDVQHVDGEVVHELADRPGVEAGETIHGAVDPEFRTYCMRAHTASHALYGAGRLLLDDLGYGGFDIDERKVRVDFATPTDIDDETLVELERLVNRVVWESRAVTWEELAREEALAREDIAFNTKTEEGVTGQERIRVVEIEDWDVAACGGTHVRNTREIGPVSVLDRSNPGEGLTRVEFAVGPPAIERRAEEAAAARGAAAELDTGPTELEEAVARLADERETLTEQVQDLREQVVEARLSDLEGATVSRDGAEWLAGSVPTTDANALAEFAQRLVDESADVVALVGEEGAYLAVATDGSADAGEIVDDVTAEFGGGGGGGPTVAQGGGLDADPGDVVAFLRE
ncbi:MAG: alanyl-tRNA synthetase [Haloarculaceae archaeon]|jgi:alanyl-tRNA synthetase